MPADCGNYQATPQQFTSVHSERIMPLPLFTGSARVFAKMARLGENARRSCQPTSGSKIACAAAMVRACAPARPVLTSVCKGSNRHRDVTSLSSPNPTRVSYAAASYTPATPATSKERCGGCTHGFQSKRSPRRQSLWPDGKHAFGIRNDQWIKPFWSWSLMIKG